ncbi:hypothetical protein LCGC14_0509630 [marine sediment metagenome]|uniref:Uncharacterized protein n=1 Tax=marine sediment metagenome TaxID=412755 RepID=A0A0F9SK34_9ZZZZ|nr:hypothetical protein [bacterium]
MIDWEVVASPGFVILSIMSLGATALGYLMGIKMEWTPMPIWQLIALMFGELVAIYVIVSRA